MMQSARTADSYTQSLINLGLLAEAERAYSSMRCSKKAKHCTEELGKFARKKAEVHDRDHWKKPGILNSYACEFAQSSGPYLFDALEESRAGLTASAAVWPADQLR